MMLFFKALFFYTLFLIYCQSKQVNFQIFNSTLPFLSVSYNFSKGDIMKVVTSNFYSSQSMSIPIYYKIVVARMEKSADYQNMEIMLQPEQKQVIQLIINIPGVFICILVPQLGQALSQPIQAQFELQLELNHTRVDYAYQRVFLVPEWVGLIIFHVLDLEIPDNCLLRIQWGPIIKPYLIQMWFQQSFFMRYNKKLRISYKQIEGNQIKSPKRSLFFNRTNQRYIIGLKIDDYNISEIRLIKQIVFNVTTFEEEKCQNQCSIQPYPVIGKQKGLSSQCLCGIQNYRWDPIEKKCVNIDFCGNNKKSTWEQCDNGNGSGCINCTIEKGFDCTKVRNLPSLCLSICGDSFKTADQQCDNGKKQGCKNCQVQKQFCCTTISDSTCLPYSKQYKQSTSYKCVHQQNSLVQITQSQSYLSTDGKISLIIGGVGGVVLFLGCIIIGICIIKRRRSRNIQGANNIPIVTQRSLLIDNQIQCSICLGCNCQVCTPCNHFYHGQCIKEWLRRRKSCPNCRQPIHSLQAND